MNSGVLPPVSSTLSIWYIRCNLSFQPTPLSSTIAHHKPVQQPFLKVSIYCYCYGRHRHAQRLQKYHMAQRRDEGCGRSQQDRHVDNTPTMLHGIFSFFTSCLCSRRSTTKSSDHQNVQHVTTTDHATKNPGLPDTSIYPTTCKSQPSCSHFSFLAAATNTPPPPHPNIFKTTKKRHGLCTVTSSRTTSFTDVAPFFFSAKEEKEKGAKSNASWCLGPSCKPFPKGKV